MIQYFPFTHVFNTINSAYIYSAAINNISSISDSMAHQLTTNSINKDDPEYIELLELGYLRDVRIAEIKHPKSELMQTALKKKINSLVLQVTQNCNLRCAYCAYSGNYENRTHSSGRMKVDIAYKAVDLLIKNSMNSPSIDIAFYGGEPLLEYELIKAVVDYAKKRAYGKKITFRTTTNGTLLTPEKFNFLADHQFSILVSLDGYKEIHDKNRLFHNGVKGSYEVIMRNIRQFKVCFPEYVNKKIKFNSVLDIDTDIRQMNDFFAKNNDVKHHKARINLISDSYTENKISYSDEFKNVYYYERFKVLLYKIGELDSKYVSKLFGFEYTDVKDKVYRNFKSVGGINSEVLHPSGPCEPCIRKVFIDVLGNIFPCERVSESSNAMNLGNVDNGIDVSKVNELLNIGQITENNCKNCWAILHCDQCVIQADDLESLNSQLRLGHCNGTKKSIESKFKTYCTLLECGVDFSSEDFLLQQID